MQRDADDALQLLRQGAGSARGHRLVAKCPPALPKMTGVLPKTKNPYFLENYFTIFGNPPTPNV